MFVRGEDRSIVSPKSKLVQNIRARQAVNPKKGNKTNSNEKMNTQPFYSCIIIYCMTHCIKYMFSCLKQECKVKKGFALDENFRKTFREKEGNSNRLEFSKNFKSQLDWHQSCKSDQVDMRDETKTQPNWQLRVSLGKQTHNKI